MKVLRWHWPVLLLVLAASLVAGEAALVPPIAPRVEHRETRHGQIVTDDYFWLREKTNPAVIEYLNAENAYTDSLTQRQKPLEETLYQEMLGRIKQNDLSVPIKQGQHYYYSRTEEGKQYPVQCRRPGSMEGAEQILLDLNELAKGHTFFALGAFAVSDDENLLAYTSDTTGFRQYQLHVKDLRTGELLPDTAERVTSVQWAADNRTLVWTTEDPVTKRSDKLWRHALGGGDPELVHDEKDELFEMRTRRTSDRKFILVNIHCADMTELRYLPSDAPAGKLGVMFPRAAGHRYRADHRDGVFYVVTNFKAKNFQIVKLSDEQLGKSLTVGDVAAAPGSVFVAPRPETTVQNVDLFKDFAVVLERTEGLNRIRTYDFRDSQWRTIEFDEEAYTATPQANMDFDGAVCRYTYQSLVTPPSVYDYDMATQTPKVLKRQEVLGGYDPAKYESQRLWATARDGVRVPISIVTKRGQPRDGSAPLLLYAYGSYGVPTPATFSSDRLSLLDRGMAFAIAHIRGGNELGEDWRDAGMLLNKKNTFNDFVDCAQYLVDQHWTSPQRLCIEGYSAGGLLMGAVVNQRPELFRAVHLGVPFVDVMNTMWDASLPLTTGEYVVWGNPNDKTFYDYMLSYSPYENLSKRNYPAMLVTGSLNDSQVMYWEPAKYVARLRPLKTDANQLLLKTNMGAGHGGASGRYDRLREEAFRYAWMLQRVGIEK